MGRGRHGRTNQSLIKGNKFPGETILVKRTKTNQTKPAVNIQPELMNLLRNADPALLVNFLTS